MTELCPGVDKLLDQAYRHGLAGLTEVEQLVVRRGAHHGN
jgi:hypothetical protein